jgi:hypothetical protein
MILSRRLSVGLFLISPLLAIPGCNNTDGVPIEREKVAIDISEVVCEAYASCTCPLDAIESADECATAIQPSLERAIVEAEQYGLHYFDRCLGKTQKLMEALGCGAEFDATDENLQKLQFEASVCKLFAGEAQRGDPCTNVGGVALTSLGDTCAHDLVCGGGICISWPDSRGDICEGIGVCPPQLACTDPDADGVRTCEKPGESGDECNPHDFGAGCGPDLFCSETGRTCVDLPSTGMPCVDGTCASGNACVGDVCAALPGTGQQCPQGICAEGLQCNPTSGTCASLPTAGQNCLGGFGGCAIGLVCASNGVCEAAPAFVCSVPDDLGLCVWQADGICDEPGGTGFCQEGTDPVDCGCEFENNGQCDEPEGTGLCNEGTDPVDCGAICLTVANGVCDEPEGTATCPEGSDAADCGATPCPSVNDGMCNHPAPEGDGSCEPGTDAADCGAVCPTANDGMCNEPEIGDGTCVTGTDTADCADVPQCPTTNDGECNEPVIGDGTCPVNTDSDDCLG